MNPKTAENPPAFAMPGYQYTGQMVPCNEGMTLRDYFAAKAMVAEMITTFSDATPDASDAFEDARRAAGHTTEQHLAFNAYKIADAMLAERAKGTEATK